MQEKLCDENEVRAACGGVGRTKYWEIVKEIGHAEPDGVKKLGRLTRVRQSALQRYLERLPSAYGAEV